MKNRHRHDDLIDDGIYSPINNFLCVNFSLTDMWDDLITPLDILSSFINRLQTCSELLSFHKIPYLIFFVWEKKKKEKTNTDGRESTRTKWRLC